jgi:UDP-2,3-diacylglucosamine pyrophosphatase LpxH
MSQPFVTKIGTVHHKYLFISDTHLGSKFAKAKELCQFLDSVEVENLYIVGDFIDFWALKRHNLTHWGKAHNEVLRALLNKMNNGTKVVWVTGNHDPVPTNLLGEFKNLEIVTQTIVALDLGWGPPKRYLVLHGQQFDAWLRHTTFLYSLGNHFYEKSLTVSKWLSVVREKFGYKPWSLSQFLKNNTKQSLAYLGNFEKACAIECAKHDVDGIIAGHIHHPVLSTVEHDGKTFQYINCGDWVESLSYVAIEKNKIIIEHF